MMDKIIYNYHKSSYIPEIQKFEFHITHVQITGTSNCGESLQTAFKSCHTDLQIGRASVIFMPNHLIWQRKQCVSMHIQIMNYQTGNES